VPASHRNSRLAFQPEGYGTIICQPNLHIGTKTAGFNRIQVPAAGIYEMLEKGFSSLWLRGPGETCACPLFRICRERELWHEQQGQTFVDDAAIHAALGVRKHPVGENSFCEPYYVLLAVIAMHRDQHEQSAPDLANRFAVNGDRGLGDALQEPNHF